SLRETRSYAIYRRCLVLSESVITTENALQESEASMNSYARSDMLVEPEWLAEHLDDPAVRRVDCDLAASFERVHIAGAVSVKEHYYKDPNNPLFIMGAADFAATMEEMGIGDDTLVVGYDNLGARYSSRLWWCLNYYGHTAARILNGGFP